jgi:hypothetical protein
VIPIGWVGIRLPDKQDPAKIWSSNPLVTSISEIDAIAMPNSRLPAARPVRETLRCEWIGFEIKSQLGLQASASGTFGEERILVTS